MLIVYYLYVRKSFCQVLVCENTRPTGLFTCIYKHIYLGYHVEMVIRKLLGIEDFSKV